LPVIALPIALVIVLHPDGRSTLVGAQEATETPTDTATPTDTPTPTVTPTPQPNAMAVDADPSDPDIDSSVLRQGGEPFQVSFDITNASTAWAGYRLAVDHAGLTFIPTSDLSLDGNPESWDYKGLGGTTVDAVVSVPQTDRLQGESARTSGSTMETGQAVIATFQCEGPGTSTIHLVTSSEDPDFYTTTLDGGAVPIITSLADATITCSADTPTPTPTPTPPAVVGGMAELPLLAASSAEEAVAPADGSGWSAGSSAALAGGLAAAVPAIAAGAWYGRRRWLR
jgi:hypothetical protein